MTDQNASQDLIVAPGLRNVGYAPTGKCLMDEHNLKLYYCGYDVAELARYSTFEECAYILLYEKLPSLAELREFRADVFRIQLGVVEQFNSGAKLYKQLRLCDVRAHPMDTLRTLVSLFGCNDLVHSPADERIQQTMRLVAAVPVCIAAIGLYQRKGWWGLGAAIVDRWNVFAEEKAGERFSCAGSFLTTLHGRQPAKQEHKALDTSLILYLEHEFNAGTHAVHTVTSTNADLYSSVIAGACALKGDAHGGANEAVLDLLEEIGTKERAEEIIDGILARECEGETIKGFGHGVYKQGDPRCAILKPLVKKLAKTKKHKALYELAEYLEQIVFQKKRLYPNVDFWTAPLYAFLGIPKNLATPLFEMARVVGWAAHHMEYRALNRTKHNRLILIRPRPSAYVGPDPRPYIPIEKRDERGR